MAVEQSILKATKAMLDIAGDDSSFDSSIMTHINGALADLLDIGAGPEDGFVVIDADDIWDDLQESPVMTEWIKNWLYLKVRLVFDPQQTGFLMDAHQKQIDEATWRISNKKDGERYKATHPTMTVIGGN